ncbi:MAG: hypothetical protein CMP86_03955 [Gammaproteobacteria bacterium]|nr:hypothetical protein [Gammaproteobacteria bacterium]
MNKFYALPVAVIALLFGCAGQSDPAASATMAPQQPWLCQDVNGKWQCNRGAGKPLQPADAIGPMANAPTLEPEALSAANTFPSSLDTPVVSDIAPSTAATPTAPEVEVIKTTSAATVENAWTIQWAALSTAAAAQQYGIKYLADSGTDYEIRTIRVNDRDYYILFSGRYPSRATAAEAAKQIQTASSEAPFFRTLSSIIAATAK